jgi:urease accessory protein
MEHSRQWLRLMQLSSSSLPVGSFTWSQGLEWAVEAGWVTSADAFKRWQIQQMEQSFSASTAAVYPRCTRPASNRNWPQQTLDGTCACRETRELREEERNRGAAFTRLIKLGAGLPELAGVTCTKPALRHGVARRALGHWRTRAGLSLGYSWIESAVMAGVKLVPLGNRPRNS